ncbi:hypothetical protein [Legionella oakridgensis]|uniref:Tfp pilus assembly protein PilX n=2 Tax=Legionella oakridgensis TaxID=29423 RepID=W0BDA9_9GAMM|nr:hypothetical protein [Legionella oakridgensis]AHE66622.1 hypothetical protein Loa_01066 [Legionella oakridgensis ATCC 33761 = DSM 21215]KTD37783.1 hypothetical protein Loak_1459 [Legionella oakridgensis]STY19765.1 Uncharacterised protein [Legionella longbeachae]
MAKTWDLQRWYGRDRGMVLLTTIILISMLAFLVLSLMQGVFLYSKASAYRVVEHQEFYQLEATAYKLVFRKEWHAKPHCVARHADWSQIEQALAKPHCTVMLAEKQYHYLIEDLGEYSELCILADGKTIGSHHWLLSVMNSRHDALQLRIAEPSGHQSCELSQQQMIAEGVISWRYLRHQ